MNKLLSHNKSYTVIGMLLLVSLLVAIGAFLQVRVQALLNSYVEDQVAMHARSYSMEINESVGREMDRLRNLRKESSSRDWQSLLANEAEGRRCGLLTLQGKAVYGPSCSPEEWRAVRSAVHGRERINYKRGQGIFFTEPVYNGQNIRYVLYSFYDEEAMHELLRVDCFDGAGHAVLMLQEQNIPISFDAWTEADEQMLSAASKEGLVSELQNMVADKGTGAMFYDGGAEGGVVFFAADVPQIRGTLLGYVPYEKVCGQLLNVTRMVMLVFVLLAALFAGGCVYLLRAELRAGENEELRKAREAADNANRAKSDFLASMSHEIRTPLNAILGLNELILRESKDDHVREYGRNIEGAGRALLALINDILDFSKVEVGRLNLAPRRYELAKMIYEVVQMIKVQASKKGLDFEIHLSEDMPRELYGDPGRVRQVLVNLLTNAVKYTHQGKVKLVMTWASPHGWNTGALEPPDDIENPEICLLACRVEDTGIGIRRADLKKLFRLFVRLEEKRNRNIEGTGLGLALTHKLVATMGGFLDVASVYGVGSAFSVWLPQYVVDASPMGKLEDYYKNEAMREESEYSSALVAPDARLLVVDDNKMNRLVVKNLLKASRIQVTLAESGREALYKLRREHFDIILMDHMMPDLDGVETLQIALEDKLVDGIPVIALTANAISGSRERYLSLGFADYLSKPVGGRQLEEMVKKHLPPKLLQKQEVLPPVKRENLEAKAVTAAETDKLAGGAVEAAAKAEREIQENEVVTRLKSETKIRMETVDYRMVPEETVLIDEKVGLEYCADDWEIYQEMLKLFAEGCRKEQERMARAIQERDWKAYTTTVHALKSTSLSIGAAHLSDLAKALETAGKAEREEFIKMNHEAAMELYNKVAEAGVKLAARHE